MAADPDGGYWTASPAGGLSTFGGAPSLGSPASSGIHLSQPVVGMAATSTGGGYWLVASDGGIFSYGDAEFFGSTGSIHLNKPIVGMATTPDGRGYWLVASDGGSSLTATPTSTDRRAVSGSTSPSSAWPPRPTAGATG